MTSLLDDKSNEQPDPEKFKEYIPGEGAKFKDIETLAKAKYDSDLYVKSLEAQKDELRRDYLALKTDYEARAKLEDLLDQYKNNPPKHDDTHEQPPVKNVNERPFDPNEVKKLAREEIKDLRKTEKEEANFKLVEDKLIERYGKAYPDVLKKQIQDLELTSGYVDDLARQSPKAFFKTLGLDEAPQTENFQAPPRSNQRSDNFKPTGAKKRTWSYYQELKKADPKMYLDPKTAVQMHNDAVELGDAFNDGDFYAFGR